MNVETTYRPWEQKTIEHLTQAELVHWVNWYTTGRTGPVTFDPELVVHNILLWERSRNKAKIYMESLVSEIFDHLSVFAPGGVISDEQDVAAVRSACEDLLYKEWLPNEIIRHLRWMEHVDPRIGKELALNNLRVTKQQAEERIQRDRNRN